MAAKVLMVAVPTTLLGLASIRVYGVNEAKMDGLIPPRQLCVYDPIPKAQHYLFIADKPGVMERGLSSVRETSMPFVTAVQGAFVSVKVRTINLYHAGEDVYHFLCAPPPGFLVRVGTITMAGLVGMILARRGSTFKRVAVPLSLTTVGATVCYPAQAVVLVKVSGKKLYAASQWSSATVSSLFTSSPKDPGTSPSPQTQPPAQPKSLVEEDPVAQCPEPLATPDDPVQAVIPSESQAVEEATVGEEPSAETPIIEETTKAEEPPAETQTLKEASTAETQTLVEAIAAEEPPVETQTVVEAISAEEPPVETQTVEEIILAEEPRLETQTVEEIILAEEPPVETQTVVEAISAEEPPVETQTVVEVIAAEELLVETPTVVEVIAAEEPPVETHTMEEATTVETPTVEEAIAAEEPPAQTDTPTTEAPQQEPDSDKATGGSRFQPDPKLLDFGQSSPEDKDMYSTRS